MPIRVDHDERRREVGDIACRLIARAGIEAVTFRDIAREAGCSTRIVSHYFHSKRELLLYVFLETAGRSLADCETALASGAGVAEALEHVLPLDETRRRFWQVWLAFWGKIAEDPEFRDAQMERARGMRDLIERLLAASGNGATAAELRFESDRLLTAVIGIATQGVFDPDTWTAERQRRHLDAEIAALRRDRDSRLPGNETSVT
ncbi:MAG TPA: TetR/AcrR family transcriptional regulator [Stellaceae bacterium]|nr:TetR/AcrR family transcriptional regulator [Stellaceae bacterium]